MALTQEELDRRDAARDERLVALLVEKGAVRQTSWKTYVSIIGATIGVLLGGAALVGYLLLPRAEAEERFHIMERLHDDDMGEVVKVVTENTTVNRLQEQRLIANEGAIKDLAERIERRHGRRRGDDGG